MVTITEEVLGSRAQRYTLAVPEGYATAVPAPLIIALHWGGQVTPYYGKPFLATFIEPALRQTGAIMVAPDCQHGGWDNPQSEAEVMALLAAVKLDYAIDPAKIVLAGYSMGGIGTWYMAARHPDVVSAAIIMAAPAPRPETARGAWRLPLYVVHSRDDEHFSFAATAAAVQALQEEGAALKFTALEGVSHYKAEEFVPALRAAVPWLQKVWSERKPGCRSTS